MAGPRALLAPLIGLLVLGACAPAARESAPPAAAPPASASASGAAPAAAPAPVSARLAYTTIAASVAGPVGVAMDAGYLREQGLDVTLVRIDPGAAVLAAMQNREVDIVQAGGPSLVLGNLQGLETMIIASAQSMLDGSVFGRAEIQRPEDFRGKTIAVSRLKAITDVGARLAFQRLGLEPDVDVFTRGTGGIPESMAAMEAGATDGASLSFPTVLEARKRGFREVVSITDLNILFLSGAFGATRTALRERPEVAERTLRALAQAISRLRTDRALALEVIGRNAQIDDQELLGQTLDYYRPLWVRDLYPDLAAAQAVLDAEEHPGARTARPTDMVDTRFADQLRASGFVERLPQ